jgi:hypothetical protein
MEFYRWFLRLKHKYEIFWTTTLIEKKYDILKIASQQQDELDKIIRELIGDEFFEQNRNAVAQIEKITGRSVMELWDTDPIFNRFPTLRGLARNAEFEKMWEKMKAR